MKKVIVIGGGISGMQTAITLEQLGVKTVIVEKSDKLGGKLNNWYKLFPDLTPAHEIVDKLISEINDLNIEVNFNAEVQGIDNNKVTLTSGETIEGDAVVVCNGFNIFDAKIKEEYGYGIYNNVMTSVELEAMFKQGSLKENFGDKPQRIAILHCVGSRDEKVGQRHCSKVCCITAVKQAIELKEAFPECEIFNFYMDIRMFNLDYEQMYRDAQVKHNVHFVRGRISEASETIDNKIRIKAEDTLIGRPLRMSVDKLILMVGMCSEKQNVNFAKNSDIKLQRSGFLEPKDVFGGICNSNSESIFYAGTATAPKTVGECLSEATSAGYKIAKYLK